MWALYCRSLLLWNFCNRLLSHSGPRTAQQAEVEADALQESWNEAQAIQDSLEIHICNYETGVTYLCQEYIYKCDLNPLPSTRGLLIGTIYSTRMSVTQALRKCVYVVLGPRCTVIYFYFPMSVGCKGSLVRYPPPPARCSIESRLINGVRCPSNHVLHLM